MKTQNLSSESLRKDSINTVDLKRKLQFVVKLIGFCYRWSKRANQKYKRTMHYFISFTDLFDQSDSSEIDLDENVKAKIEMMHFNQMFTELNSLNLNGLLRDTLSKVEKNSGDIRLLRSLFKNMPHMSYLNKLTAPLQETFFRHCWLEEYDKKRIIVAQNQTPNFVYFILSGSLVCTYRKDTEHRSSTICFLEKGMHFGDLPVLSKSVHSTSLISRTNVQLLVIGKADFVDIFVDPKYENSSKSNVEQSIEFLREIQLLNRWPLELLRNKPEMIKLRTFDRNQVISADTRLSRYIYIVLSGNCSLCTRINMKEASIAHSNVCNDNRLNTKLILEAHHFEVLKRKENRIEAKVKPNEMVAFLSSVKQQESKLENNKTQPAPKGLVNLFQTKKLNSQNIGNLIENILPNYTNNLDKQVLLKQIYESKNKQMLPRIGANKSDLSRVVNLFDSEHLLIQKLYTGSVYGLNDILFNDQPNMQLISNGCECILIDKDYFIRNATKKFLKELCTQVSPFPDTNHIHKSYIEHMNWKVFTQEVLFQTMERKKLIKKY